MSTPFIGEIRIFPYVRGAPVDWQVCDGSLLSISEYEALYQLIGTTYGGDGQSTFAVPDLRARVPLHQGQGPGLSAYALGQTAGSETVTLTVQQMPSHFHNIIASTAPAAFDSPAGTLPAAVVDPAVDQFYTPDATGTATNFPASTVSLTGGNQPHDNTAPTLTLRYCIATVGIFPSQG
jgi:microcystin-dependent protein